MPSSTTKVTLCFCDWTIYSPGRLRSLAEKHDPPVIGITGTGGAGKSTLTDELVLRFLLDMGDINIAVISCDQVSERMDKMRLNDVSRA